MSDTDASSHSIDGQRGPVVLVVEDEPSIAEPFSRALARAGFPQPVANQALRMTPEDAKALVIRLKQG